MRITIYSVCRNVPILGPSKQQRGVSALIERLLGCLIVFFLGKFHRLSPVSFFQMSSPDTQIHCGLVSLQDKVLCFALNYPDEFFFQSCLSVESPCWWQKELCHIRKFISPRNKVKQQFQISIASQQLKAIIYDGFQMIKSVQTSFINDKIL
jgi:hypothetical protein